MLKIKIMTHPVVYSTLQQDKSYSTSVDCICHWCMRDNRLSRLPTICTQYRLSKSHVWILSYDGFKNSSAL